MQQYGNDCTDAREEKIMEDYFDAKQYLNQLKKLDTIIEQKKEELSLLYNEITGGGGIDYAKDRVQTSPQNAQEERICRYVAMEDEIKSNISDYTEKRHRIIDEIHKLKDKRHMDVLYKHYVEFKGFRAIAKEMHFSYEYIRHLHKDALHEFEKNKS
jgi:predicted ATP-dependent protease